ncbi:MAG: PorT family protein [Flavobacteriales bacterium]|jgi:hypothetical protein|nr:PorT family protein [Flavobacteriales bacterium]
MKKILLLSIAYLIGNLSFAQLDNNENNVKNFRFGLKIDLSVDWMKPEDQRNFKSNGSSVGYGWGAQLEYRLNKTASIVTGFGLQTARGKIDYIGATSFDSTYYILNNDQEFVDFDTTNFSGNNLYWLQNRNYKINYVTIPIALKMKTKEIGYFTYYGTFGLNLGIKTKSTVNDEVVLNTSTNKTNIENLDISSETSFARTGLIIGGGAEYTISGNTALFFDVTYNYFFSNAVKKNDKYLGVYKNGDFKNDINQKFIPGSVALTVGVLF